MPCARRSERHVIAADPVAVRALLERLEAGPALAAMGAAERECTLLVLGEALNNVVEHGYGGGPGWIGVLRGPGGAWRIVDGARPAPPDLCDLAAMPEEAAEGGFGWPLIHALTDELRLRRRLGKNVLTLRVRAEEGDFPLAAAMTG